MSRIRVAVLMGGRSAEREVSLSTGRQVLQALDPARYEAFPVDTACLGMNSLPDPARVLGTPAHAQASPAWVSGDALPGLPAPADPPLVGGNRPDVAFLCLHGRYGEDGTVQGMLELFDIPYTGSGVLASALAMNKVMAKKLLRAEGVPVPPDVTVRGRAEADAYLRDLAFGTAAVCCPAVVKPSEQGSTIGISIVKDAADMAAALDMALAFDDEVLIEKFVDGIEITAPVIGLPSDARELECLPLVEIVPKGGFYDYEAKYTPGATEEIVPARITDEQTRVAKELGARAHRALGCRGYSRTDLIVAKDGIWVLELNTLPGMTPTSLLPRSAAAAGIPFAQLVDRIIQLALQDRREAEDRTEDRPSESTPIARP